MRVPATRTALQVLVFVAVVALGARASSAAPLLYAVDRDGNPYTTDGATGASTLVGNSGAALSNEIEVDPLAPTSGWILYGPDRTQELQRIDLTTATLLGTPLSLPGEFGSLEFANGTLYGSGGVNGFYSIDTVTGAATLIGAGVRAGGLAYDAASGTMYGTGFDGFYTIDLGTGAKTIITTTPVSRRNLAIGADGLLYVEEGGLFTVDPATGQRTAVGPTQQPFFTGLDGAPPAAAPVPEPATILMLGTGAACAAVLRRRSRSKRSREA